MRRQFLRSRNSRDVALSCELSPMGCRRWNASDLESECSGRAICKHVGALVRVAGGSRGGPFLSPLAKEMDDSPGNLLAIALARGRISGIAGLESAGFAGAKEHLPGTWILRLMLFVVVVRRADGVVRQSVVPSSVLPNDLRFCCGGLRRPPPSRQTYPARGRRAEAPAGSKRGLDGRTRRHADPDAFCELDTCDHLYEEASPKGVHL